MSLFFQNELPINNTSKDSSDPWNGIEIGQQVYTKDGYTRDRNGSEPIEEGGDNSTQSTLAFEERNTADDNEDVETYGHDGLPAKETSTPNGIRGQVSLTEHAGEPKDTKTGGAGKVSQDGDDTLVQENGPQVAGSKNSTNHEVGIHEGGVATHDTVPQREEEGSGNKGAEVTPSIGEDVGLDNTDGNPSGDGEDEDADTGSGDHEGIEAGEGKGSHDDSKGQEGQSHGEKDGNRGQSSASTEDGDSEEKEGSPNGRDGDNGSSSEEDNGTEEGNGGQAMQESQKLGHNDSRGPEGGILSQSEACPPGKSHSQVSF